MPNYRQNFNKVDKARDKTFAEIFCVIKPSKPMEDQISFIGSNAN